jgi:hypothetical protein
LALKARKRLPDAVQIVRDLTETLEDPRFANSRFRALGDTERVKQTRDSLTAKLTAVMGHAGEITFEGVFVEEPHRETWSPQPTVTWLRSLIPVGKETSANSVRRLSEWLHEFAIHTTHAKAA